MVTIGALERSAGGQVAIAGMAGRFSNADCLDTYWANVLSGQLVVDGRDVRRAFISAAGLYTIEGTKRPLLPAAQHALHATHLALLVSGATEALDGVGVWLTLKSWEHDTAALGDGSPAAWLANAIQCRGLSFDVASECSSVLVAIERAVFSLHNHICDTAIVCAVHLGVENLIGRRLRAGLRQGDYAEAAGAIVLKRVSDIPANSHHAPVVIRAIECEAESAPGLSRNLERRVDMLRRAFDSARLMHGCTIHVELQHFGRGVLAECYECEAFRQALEGYSPSPTIGGVASTVGYAAHAAGLAEVQKGVLALRSGKLPSSVRRLQPASMFSSASSGFRVPTALESWLHSDCERLWCVSSAGGGRHGVILMSIT